MPAESNLFHFIAKPRASPDARLIANSQEVASGRQLFDSMAKIHSIAKTERTMGYDRTWLTSSLERTLPDEVMDLPGPAEPWLQVAKDRTPREFA